MQLDLFTALTARLVCIVITKRLTQYAGVGLFFISYFVDYRKVSETCEWIGLCTIMLLLSS